MPVCFIAILIIYFSLSLPHKGIPFVEGMKLMDAWGILAIVCGVVSLLLPMSWGGATYPWTSGQVIALFFVFAFFAGLFIFVELKVAKNPVIPMGLFKIRNFVVSYFIMGGEGREGEGLMWREGWMGESM